MIILSDEDVLKECEKLGVAGVEAALASGSFTSNNRPALQWLAERRMESESLRHQQTMKYAFWALIFSGLTALAAIISVWIQKVDNHEQRVLAKIQSVESNLQANSVIAEITRIASAVGETALQNTKTLEAVYKANGIANIALQENNKPYIIFARNEMTPLEINRQFQVKPYFINSGKSPAVNVHATMKFQLSASSSLEEEPIKRLPGGTQDIMSVNQELGFYVNPIPSEIMKKEQIESINIGTTRLILHMRIDYDSTFKKHYTTFICQYYDTVLKRFISCATGNYTI